MDTRKILDKRSKKPNTEDDSSNDEEDNFIFN